MQVSLKTSRMAGENPVYQVLGFFLGLHVLSEVESSILMYIIQWTHLLTFVVSLVPIPKEHGAEKKRFIKKFCPLKG